MGQALGILSAACFSLAALGPSDADACGGCFHPPTPPGQPVSVITDHRMILSISPQQSTLYDQIRYQGAPSDFAWVLPINGAATIGLSSDTVFSTIDQMTETTVEAPPMNCPSPPSYCSYGAGGADTPSAGFGAADGGTTAGGVNVTHEQVVGPYETVQLHATDPNALNDWLTSHNYVIPDDVKPIIAAYVNEHFDFLAMKLVPGQGVQAMRPVRVSTAGASPILPLRMVAAGTGAQVGITLWVFADGRYEPQNFNWFHIPDSDIAWDWSAMQSNYTTLRQQQEQAAGFKTWEMESSLSESQSSLRSYLTSAENGFGPNAGIGNDYPATQPDDAGAPGESSQQLFQDDLNALFAGIGEPMRVTRLRADLAHDALVNDLVLQASADQSALSNVHQATKELNEPQCPIYEGCNVVGTGTRTQANNAMHGNSGDSFSCAIRHRARTIPLAVGTVLGVLAILTLGSRRKRAAS